MKNLVRNATEYPTTEVSRIVRATLRDLDVTGVAVTVRYCKDGWPTGHYRAYWYPKRGEDREQITVGIPQPGVAIDAFVPYERKDAPPSFDLADWREALVAVAAHEGMHHRQTPRNGYQSSRKAKGGRRRYVESECDWAAYRAVRRWREQQADCPYCAPDEACAIHLGVA